MTWLACVPTWGWRVYWAVALACACLQGYRGIVEQRHSQRFREAYSKRDLLGVFGDRHEAEAIDVTTKRQFAERIYTDLVMTERERWVIMYAHDFFFRLVCTIAGFASLAFAWLLAIHIDPTAFDAATGAALAIAFFVGVVGVGGQLHYVILWGKWPK